MVDAICREVALRREYLAEPVQTVYFGGGTPSLLTPEHLDQILGTLRSHFTLTQEAEYTLEANPDDISPSSLHNWRLAGINRLSIGIQSFFEEDLRWMNRAHTATQAAQCIQLALDHGFTNLTADLIYGSPGLTDEKWAANVQQLQSLGVPHMSCYAMTVEPKTALAGMIRAQRVQDVDPGHQERQFHLLLQWMEEKGYEQYEISNFALPGFRSKHNSSYWQGTPYIGLGPSAHSFNGYSRQWNVSNNALYIQALAKNTLPFEEEILTDEQQFNEYIMTALRTAEGVSLDRIAAKWPRNLPVLLKSAQKHLAAGNLLAQDQKLVLSNQGKFLADGIASDLFI